jgi:UPI00016E42D7 related cluster
MIIFSLFQIFQAFNKYSRVATGGYTSINEVRDATNVHPKDKQESFWIAETLKYLFLLFSDDAELNDKLMNTYIFNTEGHLIYKNLPKSDH